MLSRRSSPALLRTRWAAIGAAVAVSLGAGGFGLAGASIGSGDKPVTVTIDAERILDTRTSIGLAGKFADATPRDLQVTGPVPIAPSGMKTVVPVGATAVLVNVTVVFPSDPGFLALRPGDATGEPTTSTVNFFPGSVEPNAATVDLSPTGTIELWLETASDSGNAHVLVDVVGYTIDHTHDDRYYGKTQVYTKAQVDALLADKLDKPTGASSIVVPAAAFTMQRRSDLGLTYDLLWMEWTAGSVASVGDCVVAPLLLPVGATMTEFGVAYYFDTEGDTIDANLLSIGFQTGLPSNIMANVFDDDGAAVFEFTSDTSITSPVVDAQTHYAVSVCLTGDAELEYVEIDFTHPS